MSRYYVYIYSDPTDRLPFYVGKGKGSRFRRHLTDNGHSRPVKMKVQSIRESGENPVIDIIDCENEQNAFDLERSFITLYGRRSEGGLLFNIAPGGEATLGFKGRKHTPESKARISAAIRGRVISPETIEKLRCAGLKRDVSHLHSPESIERRKIIAASPEFRKNMSAAIKQAVSADHLAVMTQRAAERNRGCKRTIEHRLAISRAVKSRVISDETRAKMSAAQKRRYAK